MSGFASTYMDVYHGVQKKALESLELELQVCEPP